MKDLANDEYSKLALEEHKSKNYEKALDLYRKSLAHQHHPEAIIFSNYGSLLREKNRCKEAFAVYRRGIKLYPGHHMLLRNYGNLLLQEGESAKALGMYLRSEDALPSDVNAGKREILHRLQAQALSDLGHPRLAIKILDPVLRENPADSPLRLGIADLWVEINNFSAAKYIAEPLLGNWKPDLKQAYMYCNLLLKLGKQNEALESFDEAIEQHKKDKNNLDEKSEQNLHATCWNFALMLLRKGIFRKGWDLFEHGRKVPNGRGGMQRTVFKAHSSLVIPEWDGKNLKGKRLLINGEQGIGDTMMFTMLIPNLINEAEKIGIITYDRLTELYKRSFPDIAIYDAKDLKKENINADDWDLQIPCGSLPMLRYWDLDQYKNLHPYLRVNTETKEELQLKYKNSRTSRLIGFSWKGGGNAKQKRTKSLKLEDFLPLFKIPNTTWISLQYGDVNDELRAFSQKYNINLVIPDDVDPLQDMDKWSSLVSCCDQVISAANTTIHGAGCLGIPTTVILGKDPDWRWLGDSGTPCYWYPSVDIVRQTVLNSWESPIAAIEASLHEMHQPLMIK